LAAAQVAVQLQGRLPGDVFFMSGPGAAVDEQEVGPAVVVEVDDGDAGAHRLGQQLHAERAGEVLEADAGRAGDVRESNGGDGDRLAVQGRARGDGGGFHALRAPATGAQRQQAGRHDQPRETEDFATGTVHEPLSWV